jgi:hypothetical protein
VIRQLLWNCAFRSTFRLFPDKDRGPDLVDVFLSSNGLTEQQILATLPYDKARSANPGTLPDPKRYRDGRQLLRTVGLVYEADDMNARRLCVTSLGRATSRWRPVITEKNALVLGRHAAQALAACQLRNPTTEGMKYGAEMEVFPFAFIWRAMLELGGSISSDELNRAIFHVRNEAELVQAIKRIRNFRKTKNLDDLGAEVVSEQAKNDRVLVWMAWASFGWTLIHDKRSSSSGVYEVPPNMITTLSTAARIRHRHRTFGSESEYVEHISACAGLPEDIR